MLRGSTKPERRVFWKPVDFKNNPFSMWQGGRDGKKGFGYPEVTAWSPQRWVGQSHQGGD